VPTSRVAAAKRIGGGFDKGERASVVSYVALPLMLAFSGQRCDCWSTSIACNRDGHSGGQVNARLLAAASRARLGYQFV
jgi:hypothetical protein